MSTLLDHLDKTLPRNKWRKHHRNVYFRPFTDVLIDFHNSSTTRILGKIDLDLAHRVMRTRQLNNTVMLTAMLYSQRFRDRVQSSLPITNDTFDLNSIRDITSTDLFMLSLMLASKYLYDEGSKEEIFNEEWANLFHMSTSQVNKMEGKYLQFLDWKLFVSSEEFRTFVAEMELNICKKSVLSRNKGLMSWIELDTFTNSSAAYSALVQSLIHFIKVVATCVVIYVIALGNLVLVYYYASIQEMNHYDTKNAPVHSYLNHCIWNVGIPRSTVASPSICSGGMLCSFSFNFSSNVLLPIQTLSY